MVFLLTTVLKYTLFTRVTPDPYPIPYPLTPMLTLPPVLVLYNNAY